MGQAATNNNCALLEAEPKKGNTTKFSRDPFEFWYRIHCEEEEACTLHKVGGVHCAFWAEETEQMKQASRECVPLPTKRPGENYPMACNTCRGRVIQLMRWRDVNNKPFFLYLPKDRYPEEFWPLWEAARTGEITDIKAVAAQTDFWDKADDGMTWKHFSVKVDAEAPRRRNAELTRRNEILHKYVPPMMRLFSDQGVPGIHASLDTLIETLPSVTYGGKLLESATWLRKHIREDFNRLPLSRKLDCIAGAAFDTYATQEVGSSQPVLPLYHQVTKNTLDALATCNNVKALQTMLADRLSPFNYQVKTAEASVGQVAMAVKHIGDFSVRHMTLQNAIDLYGATPISHGKPGSAASAFANMSAKASKSASGAAGFAARAGTNLSGITSMETLMIAAPPDLEVNVSQLRPVYANELVGLKDGVYKTPFTWGFDNNSRPSKYGLVGDWYPVTAILRADNNFLVFCEGAQPHLSMKVCCHVGLLTPEYNRSCGQAFGNLDKAMSLDIPPNGPYAIGVGSSIDTKVLGAKKQPLVLPIVFKSNGKTIKITTA